MKEEIQFIIHKLKLSETHAAWLERKQIETGSTAPAVIRTLIQAQITRDNYNSHG